MLLGLIEPTEGRIFYEGADITGKIGLYRREIRMGFQNPVASLDPRLRIRDALLEPLDR